MVALEKEFNVQSNFDTGLAKRTVDCNLYDSRKQF